MQHTHQERPSSGVSFYPPDRSSVGFGPMVGYVSGHHKSRQIWYDGHLLDPAKSLSIVNHSPDGFNWGYMGSGPSQAALAILLEMESRGEVDRHFVVTQYQAFRDHYLASLPQFNFAISISDIHEWVKVRRSVADLPGRALDMTIAAMEKGVPNGR